MTGAVCVRMFWIILLIAAAVWGLHTFLIYPGRANPDAMEKLLGRAYAHRGLHSAHNGVPENTLEAFDVAARHGYGIELDVRLSSDGVPVVFHDDSLSRLCRIDRRVDEMTAAQLEKLRVSGSDQFIPTFEEVLRTIAGRVPLIIELKPGKDPAKLCSTVWPMLERYEGVYCVESFDPRSLAWFKRHAPGVIRGQLSTKIRDAHYGAVTRYMLENLLLNFLSRPQFIAYEHEFMQNANFRRCVTRYGAVACAWTVTDQNTFDNLTKTAPMIIFEKFFPRTRYDNTIRIVRGRVIRPD